MVSLFRKCPGGFIKHTERDEKFSFISSCYVKVKKYMKFILMHAFRGRKSACIVSTFALFLENCIEDTQANEIKIQCCNGNRFFKKFWRNECVRSRRRWSPWQCIMVHLIWYLLRDNLSSNAFREQQKKESRQQFMTVRSGHRASDKFLFCVCAAPSSSIHVREEIYGIEFSAQHTICHFPIGCMAAGWCGKCWKN